MSQPNQAQAQTEDVGKKVEEVVKNAEELRQELAKLSEVLKVKELDEELEQLRHISNDLSAWKAKDKMYFTLKVVSESGSVEIRGRVNELSWVGSYRLSDTPVAIIFNDFFNDTTYFNKALAMYSKEVTRITNILIPQLHGIVNEAKKKLSELEGRVSKIEDMAEELKDRLEDNP